MLSPLPPSMGMEAGQGVASLHSSGAVCPSLLPPSSQQACLSVMSLQEARCLFLFPSSPPLMPCLFAFYVTEEEGCLSPRRQACWEGQGGVQAC